MSTAPVLERAMVERSPVCAPVVPPGPSTPPGGPGTQSPGHGRDPSVAVTGLKSPAAGTTAGGKPRPAAGSIPPARKADTHGNPQRRTATAAPAAARGRTKASKHVAAGRYRDEDRPHGIASRYQHGPDENDQPGIGCRCTPCAEARTAQVQRRSRLKAYGRWQPFVDAEPVRAHVRMLSEHDIGIKRLAVLAGVSPGSLTALLYGAMGSPPSRRLRPKTAAAILAIQPSRDLISDGVFVDPTGTQRRVQALMAIGWTQVQIGQHMGWNPVNVASLLYQRSRITARTERIVRKVYDELWNQVPPEPDTVAAGIAKKARNLAAKRGWPPPAAWDDETIDDPAAQPPEGWQRAARRSSADLAAEARELMRREGYDLDLAAERLGSTKTAIQKAMHRVPEAAA